MISAVDNKLSYRPSSQFDDAIRATAKQLWGRRNLRVESTVCGTQRLDSQRKHARCATQLPMDAVA
jgi:hypothetical protein